MQRMEQLKNWLNRIFGGALYVLSPASSDASFRRYWRVEMSDPASLKQVASLSLQAPLASSAKHLSLVVMDAPPEHENCAPFVQIAQALRDDGVHTPWIVAQDLSAGFLLLEDCGSQTYLDALAPFGGLIPFDTPALDLVRALFDDAIAALIALQKSPNLRQANLPLYDQALLRRELELFPEWYVKHHLKRELSAAEQQVWQEGTDFLIQNILRQPQVPVHRDFTVRNLMVTAADNPAVLDFQDAVIGAITYDILSLTRDAFLGLGEELVLDLVVRYWEKARAAGLPVAETISDFWYDFEIIGVQRHLKVAGIFARLNYRDGKPKYLAEIPRFISYLLKVCNRYEELRPLGTLIRDLAGVEEKAAYTF